MGHSFFFCPTDRPTFTRGRAMGNETIYWDGLMLIVLELDPNNVPTTHGILKNQTPVYYFHFPAYFFTFRRHPQSSILSTWLLRFTPAVWFTAAYLDSTFHFFVNSFDLLFCTRVPRQKALCREFRDGFIDGFSVMKMCFWTCSSITMTFFFRIKKNPGNNTYQPKTLNMQTQGVTTKEREKYWIEIDYKGI